MRAENSTFRLLERSTTQWNDRKFQQDHLTLPYTDADADADEHQNYQ